MPEVEWQGGGPGWRDTPSEPGEADRGAAVKITLQSLSAVLL
jgi:hypothetical protein